MITTSMVGPKERNECSLADTFYWIALADLTDSAHRRAMALTVEWEDSLILTTDEVLAEYLTFFATALEQMRRKAVSNTQRILENPGVRVVPQSRESLMSGMALYESRPDKGYSLTDCISMQTMRKQGLTEVLTNDRHFEQEGFRALFRG
jgi:predicted nucleic acid-binding protein